MLSIVVVGSTSWCSALTELHLPCANGNRPCAPSTKRRDGELRSPAGLAPGGRGSGQLAPPSCEERSTDAMASSTVLWTVWSTSSSLPA